MFPLLIVPWGFAFHFLRRYLKPAEPVARGELSIADSLRAALASNRANQPHLKLVGVLYVLMIPLLALAMQQLHAVGKVSARELTSMAALSAGVLLLSGVGHRGPLLRTPVAAAKAASCSASRTGGRDRMKTVAADVKRRVKPPSHCFDVARHPWFPILQFRIPSGHL